MSKQPKPVKGWATFRHNGEVWADNMSDHLSELVPVHIAPTATHAIVELAKVREAVAYMELQTVGTLNRGAVVHALSILGLLPKPKPRKATKKLGPLLREVAAVGGMNKQAKKNLGGLLTRKAAKKKGKK